MKHLLILLMLAVCTSASAFAQDTGRLAGRVVDAADSTGLPGANVIIEGTTLGAATDLDGEYLIVGVPTGIYNVWTRFIGYQEATETSVKIKRGYTRTLNFELEDHPNPVVYFGRCGCHYVRPLIERGPYASIRTWRAGYCSGEINFADLPVGR